MFIEAEEEWDKIQQALWLKKKKNLIWKIIDTFLTQYKVHVQRPTDENEFVLRT